MFASKCQGESHAVKAALCDLGDPGWGDPWFLHGAVLLPTPSELAPVVLWRFLFCLFLGEGLRHHGTQDVIMHASR